MKVEQVFSRRLGVSVRVERGKTGICEGTVSFPSHERGSSQLVRFVLWQRGVELRLYLKGLLAIRNIHLSPPGKSALRVSEFLLALLVLREKFSVSL